MRICTRVLINDGLYMYIVVYQLCTCAKSYRLLYVKFELKHILCDVSMRGQGSLQGLFLVRGQEPNHYHELSRWRQKIFPPMTTRNGMWNYFPTWNSLLPSRSKLDGDGHDAATDYSSVLHFSHEKRDTRHADGDSICHWYDINYPSREDRDIHNQDRQPNTSL